MPYREKEARRAQQKRYSASHPSVGRVRKHRCNNPVTTPDNVTTPPPNDVTTPIQIKTRDLKDSKKELILKLREKMKNVQKKVNEPEKMSKRQIRELEESGEMVIDYGN